MSSIELDPTRLLGFRLLTDDGPGLSVLSSMAGVKGMAKLSGKIGAKIGDPKAGDAVSAD